MTFTDEQKAELAKPLNSAHVKPPAPGKYGEYIEGWRVIDEANRVFGFEGWSREMRKLDLVGEPYKDGDKWRVGYMATVRVTAGVALRDGTGYGSGIGRDLNDAHESAIKEAETDATKRALMTFGYQFGLALYDKTKEHVVDPMPASVEIMLEKIATAETAMALKSVWETHFRAIPHEYRAAVLAAKDERKLAVDAMALATA